MRQRIRQPPAEHGGCAIARTQQQETTHHGGCAGQHLEPASRGGPGPFLVGRERKVEIRSDKRDERTPHAQQNQQNSTCSTTAAGHLHPAAAGTNTLVTHESLPFDRRRSTPTRVRVTDGRPSPGWPMPTARPDHRRSRSLQAGQRHSGPRHIRPHPGRRRRQTA